MAFSAAAIVGACDPSGEFQDSGRPAAGSVESFVSEDSAGVAVRTTSCAAAMAEIGWTIDSIPDLDLGAGAPAAVQFSHVAGVASLPDRGVAVLDQGARELLYFNAQGRLVDRFGGEGAGPAEFELPFLVRTPARDSLLVFDRRLQRFTSFSVQDGGQPRIEKADEPWLRRTPAPLGIVKDRMLIEYTNLDYEMFQQSGAKQQDLKFLWVAPGSDDPTVLRTFQVKRLYIAVGEAGVPHGRSIPFSAYPSAAVSSAGPVITSGSDFEILRFDTAGSLTQVLRVDCRRTLVRSRDFDIYRMLHSDDGGDPEAAWRRFSDMPLPDSMPAFESLEVDGRGWIWAEVFEWDSRKPTIWILFDSDGRARGSVSMPAGITVHEIADDFVLGVWHDEVGVEFVRRHSMARH
jgi:hypothetical protein